MGFHIYPQDEFRIKTEYSPSTVRQILDYYTIRSEFGEMKNRHEFMGTVDADSFKIWKFYRWCRCTYPIMYGKVYADKEGSVVEVRVKFHPFMRAFMTVWFGIVISILLISLLAFLFEREPLPMVVSFAMLLFGWSNLYGPFWKLEKKQKELLRVRLNGQLIEDSGEKDEKI